MTRPPRIDDSDETAVRRIVGSILVAEYGALLRKCAGSLATLVKYQEVDHGG